MAYNVPVVVAPPQPARKALDQALACIVFGKEGHHNSTHNEGGLEVFEDFVCLAESNIWDMDSSFSKRNTAQGCINFGMRLVIYTLVKTHRAQDKIHFSLIASLTGIANAGKYKHFWGTPLDWSALRKVESNQADTISKAANPGNFKDKRTWLKWDVKFEN